jgi:hypothetical protein
MARAIYVEFDIGGRMSCWELCCVLVLVGARG